MKVVAAAAIGLVVLVFAAMSTAASSETYIAQLNELDQHPACAAAGKGSGGQLELDVADAGTGMFVWKLSVRNLPGTTTTLEIVLGSFGEGTGTAEQTVSLAGATRTSGTFTDADLLAGLRADAHDYYARVKTTTCSDGAVAAPFGWHGNTHTKA